MAVARTTSLDDYVTSQTMIDINASFLDGLREKCEVTDALTQGEIRAIETKLVKLFAHQMISNQKLINDPSMKNKNKPIDVKLWLKIVGLPDTDAQKLLKEINGKFDKLILMDVSQLRRLLKKICLNDELQRLVLDSTRNVNTYIDCLRADAQTANELELHWDSWNAQNRSTKDSIIKDPRVDLNIIRSCPTSPPLQNTNQNTDASNSNWCNTITCALNHSYSNYQQTPTNTSRSASPLLISRKEYDSRHFMPIPPSSPTSKRKLISTIASTASINTVTHITTTTVNNNNNYTNINVINNNNINNINNINHNNNNGNINSNNGVNKNVNNNHCNNVKTDLINSALIKSRSHDDKLTNKMDAENLANMENRRRLATEPGMGRGSPSLFSPVRSPPFASEMGSDSCFDDSPSHHATNNSIISSVSTSTSAHSCLPAPRSPRAHTVMKHAIHHRFVSSMKLTSIVCQLCKKPMVFGFKCKECKYRCHRECIQKVPPSCGLPTELVNLFRETMAARNKNAEIPSVSGVMHPKRLSPVPFAKEFNNDSTGQQGLSKNTSTIGSNHNTSSTLNAFGKNAPDSSSTSSCNSSNNSSPLVKNNNNNVSPQTSNHTITQAFTFPDVQSTHESVYATNASNANKYMLSKSELIGSTGSNFELDGTEHYDTLNGRGWPRQNSLGLSEWDIPFDEVKIETQIGKGRFGTVFKANWHGLVAMKIFSVSNFKNAGSAIAAFKTEVATLRKTRHHNLVLFMGACMKSPDLAIVTSFCKGDTLHYHIHVRKERFSLSSLINIAQQIAQGMSYLHSRQILHKDLKTSNIFYDPNNSKVTITDFGLFSLTKLCIVDKNNYQLQIPKGWLAYLAPELIRMLRPDSDYENDHLPFSNYTDVYSFGTVWHELLSGTIPYKGQPPEVVIWQVGKGLKQPLYNLQACKEIKDILMFCWSYRPQERPDFSKLFEIFENLPKRRLQRSPSHPTHLLHSLESLF